MNLQWDPHHKPDGNSIVNKRAIQLGIKGSFNMEQFHQNIIKIEDITDFVHEQYQNKLNGQLWIPLETVLDINHIRGQNKLSESDKRRIKLGELFVRNKAPKNDESLKNMQIITDDDEQRDNK